MVNRGSHVGFGMVPQVQVVTAVAILLLIVSCSANPAFADDCGGMFVLDYEISGSYDAYRMCMDGSDLTQLTDSTSQEFGCNWSPDGVKIVFESDRDGTSEIYVMDTDGRNVTQLTFLDAETGWPAWSPDSAEIAFYSCYDGDAEICVMNADGSNVRQYTANATADYEPAWSPDASQIAWMTRRHDNGYGEIYVMNRDGSNKRRLTYRTGEDARPDWSPDGAKIVFASNPTGSNMDVYVMNSADGSNVRRLTMEAGADDFPVWSPDGTEIAFVSDRYGNNEIMVMDSSGTNQRRLTETAGSEWRFDWVAARAGVAPKTNPDRPEGLRIGGASPNPFTHSAVVTFELPYGACVLADLYDAQGRMIKHLANGELGPGTHTLTWDGVDVFDRVAGPGIYFCRIETSAGRATLKLNLTR